MPANFFVYYEIDDDESKHMLSLDVRTATRNWPVHGLVLLEVLHSSTLLMRTSKNKKLSDGKSADLG